jgi:hypothetical protein|nr:MAG TPA: hypothetical protein [Caudoviricetes sp.]
MFGKKRTLDEILKDIANLSDEDKAKIKDKMDDLYKAEDEREVDKIEEDKAENPETESEKKEEVEEESEEIGKDVDETEGEVEEDEKEESEPTEETDEEEDTDETDEENSEVDEEPQEDTAESVPEWAKGIFDRLDKIEAHFAESETAVEDKAKETYGLGNGVFQGDEKAKETKKTSPAEIRNILSKIKR